MTHPNELDPKLFLCKAAHVVLTRACKQVLGGSDSPPLCSKRLSLVVFTRAPDMKAFGLQPNARASDSLWCSKASGIAWRQFIVSRGIDYCRYASHGVPNISIPGDNSSPRLPQIHSMRPRVVEVRGRSRYAKPCLVEVAHIRTNVGPSPFQTRALKQGRACLYSASQHGCFAKEPQSPTFR